MQPSVTDVARSAYLCDSLSTCVCLLDTAMSSTNRLNWSTCHRGEDSDGQKEPRVTWAAGYTTGRSLEDILGHLQTCQQLIYWTYSTSFARGQYRCSCGYQYCSNLFISVALLGRIAHCLDAVYCHRCCNGVVCVCWAGYTSMLCKNG